MRLDDFMQTCLLHPEHGYYTTREPFGTAGDFTTAPEISQMFGELVGLALAQTWIDQGAPKPFALAELGPGRGTLMADMRRAMARVPGLTDAARITLVEASARLRQIQSARLGPVSHCGGVDELPELPLFLVANEFFDALPIRQFVRVDGGWAERMVTVSEGALALALAPPVPLPRDGAPGEVWEDRPAAAAIIAAIARRIVRHGGVALIIDYGTWDGYGDSLQALQRHGRADPLDRPGEADLTAHVDFAPLAAAAVAEGAAASAPVPQGAWLRMLGIEARAARLTAAGDAGAQTALHRLTHPAQMGHLFKVMAIWPPKAPPPPGFAVLESDAARA